MGRSKDMDLRPATSMRGLPPPVIWCGRRATEEAGATIMAGKKAVASTRSKAGSQSLPLPPQNKKCPGEDARALLWIKG
jgi:hypothetical protein